MLGSFPITEVRGVPIKVHFTTLILLLWVVGSTANLLIGMLITLLLLISVGLHELGHTLLSQRYGIEVQDIILTPLGGVARLRGLPSNPRHETRIALGGPYVSFLLFLMGGGLGFLSLRVGSGLLPTILFTFSAMNLMLFAFNLVPCFPMDGGRVLRSVLSRKRGELEATRISTEVGKYFAYTFIALGFLPQVNFTLSLIGLYMLYLGKSEYRMMQLKHWQEQQFGQSMVDPVDANFTASPPPYASTAPRPTLPENLWGDMIITWKDLMDEIGATLISLR
jgi:Zn-dependent protease